MLVSEWKGERVRGRLFFLRFSSINFKPAAVMKEGRRVEGRRVEGRRVEGRRVEGRRVEGRRVEGRRVEGRRRRRTDDNDPR
jgi:hypothetical protein